MNEDKVIQKLVEHDDRLERIENAMMTKADGQKIMQTLDEVVIIVKKIREDHVFALEWLKRLQDKVDSQDEEIRKIKMQLKIA